MYGTWYLSDHETTNLLLISWLGRLLPLLTSRHQRLLERQLRPGMKTHVASKIIGQQSQQAVLRIRSALICTNLILNPNPALEKPNSETQSFQRKIKFVMLFLREIACFLEKCCIVFYFREKFVAINFKFRKKNLRNTK